MDHGFELTTDKPKTADKLIQVSASASDRFQLNDLVMRGVSSLRSEESLMPKEPPNLIKTQTASTAPRLFLAVDQVQAHGQANQENSMD